MASKQAKKTINKASKVALVAELTEKVQKSKGLVFANYQGLTHQQLEGLKKAVQALDGDFVATKNSLILKALGDKPLSDEDKNHFNKPTATLFMYGDVVEPLKVLAKTIKDFKLPEVKFGLIEDKSVSATDVIKLSSLPAKPVLQAQLLGMMMSPVQGLHRALTWNMQSLVMTLKAIEEKKSTS
jgi:large subunit ribosomal protein L10